MAFKRGPLVLSISNLKAGIEYSFVLKKDWISAKQIIRLLILEKF